MICQSESAIGRCYFVPSGFFAPRYLVAIALERSTSLIFASVHSHAATSANSSSRFFLSSLFSAVASSPTSSMNYKKVLGVPRWRSVSS